MIRADMDLAAFTRAARIQGMRTLRDAGLDMVARGLTTIEEVVSVLPPRE
jgi:general secretion pathway protein E